VKVVANDYGSARTGVAVSAPSGTIARPLGVVERAATDAGLRRLAELIQAEEAERVVVGLPLTLRGEHGAQAQETEVFVEALRAAVNVPVESFDERFTTGLAARVGSDDAPEDAGANGAAGDRRRKDRPARAREEAAARGRPLPRADEPAETRARLRRPSPRARRLPLPGDVPVRGEDDLRATRGGPARGVSAQLG